MKGALFIILMAAVFVSAIKVVMARHETRKLFSEIQELEKVGDNFAEEWGRLQLEQSTWATDTRIESIARKELDMIEPEFHSQHLIFK